MDAIHWEYIAAGAGAGCWFTPDLGPLACRCLLLYGTVKGLGQTMPQFVVTQMAGALFGRFVMEKNSVCKCGVNTPWCFSLDLTAAPV